MIKHTIEDWDSHFMKIAVLCSQMSKDPSTKVGAVIRGTDKSIISTGYNGFPVDVPDNEYLLHNRHDKYKYIIHAEDNALKFARKRNVDLSECVIYTTMMPCEKCYQLIKDAGIKRIVTMISTPDQIGRWGSAWDQVINFSGTDKIKIEFI
jgi:dCMP deaminase